MGYVLPIQHYQYKDYQNRDMKVKQDPFYIERPYKIIFDAKHQDILQNDNDEEFTEPDHRHHQVIQQKPKQPQVDKIYADLTGKGRNYSQSI
ncbi:hypothetical protein [Virgibacillus ndiopensis]|uniref:hypothetical protein n=1 Tax=Virgibacillus ndiopensis TaxID=2004408 RepID=UPI000C06AF67|nr:hypothetical protein [Virgibacillus ndiopensis]